MAQIVMLKHKDSGLLKKGFVGFSWTTLFFGMFVWAFFYNSYYTRKLLEHGYVLDDNEEAMRAARLRLRIG